MYMILMHYKGGKKKAIYHETLHEAYHHYAAWKNDERCDRVTLFAAHWLHLTTYHPDLGEEEDSIPTIGTGRGE